MDQANTGLFPDYTRKQAPMHSTGLLPSQDIQALIESGGVFAKDVISPEQIQPASLDLRLGTVGYRVRASFLPGIASTVTRRINDLLMHEIDLTKPSVLEKGCVYIVPLLEELNLPSQISAKANPKSTTGRLDIFTRLITDYGTEFERVAPGYRGRLYLEIVPRTFSILARSGAKLNQLRFIKGGPIPSDTQLDKLHEQETLVYFEDDVPGDPIISGGLWISIDLKGDTSTDIVGYRARGHAPLIELDRMGYYDSDDFWEPIPRPKNGTIVLNPDDFYILLSREKLRVPPTFAAAMVPYDPSVGEFRIHYAGFFDPGFGYGSDDIKGTHAVLEVRSHEVPFLLEHGQVVGRLIYERLLSIPDKIYGQGIGSSYQRQGLSLSKQFKR